MSALVTPYDQLSLEALYDITHLNMGDIMSYTIRGDIIDYFKYI